MDLSSLGGMGGAGGGGGKTATATAVSDLSGGYTQTIGSDFKPLITAVAIVAAAVFVIVLIWKGK